MAFLYIFVVACSLALLFAVLFFALRNPDVAGSKAYALQIIFVSIWSIGSLMEMFSATEQQMLLWRNIEQIGVFLLPVACVYFAVDYAGYDRLKKYLPYLLIIPILAILLIFTDSQTHLMRTGYTISHNNLFGNALSVHQTLLGVLLVSYNYILVFAALMTLFLFSRQVAKGQRSQVLLVLFATALVFVLAFFKSAFLEGTKINLPSVTIYLPGGMILFYNLYKNRFFRLSPIAREKVFGVIEIGIIVTHSDGKITDMNPHAYHILNSCMKLSQPQLGTDVREVFRAYPDWVSLMQQCESGSLTLAIQNDKMHFIEVRVFPLQVNSGRSIGAVSLLRDITQLHNQEELLRARAETDSLTTLMNRDSFLIEFDRMVQEHCACGTPVSVLMMDLDKFKQINDTYGHAAGDKVLKAVADVLKAVLRHNDAIARIGGDEFVAALPNVDRQGAEEIAERIMLAAREYFVVFDTQTSIPLKLSIGICDNMDTAAADEMLRLADQAMYHAKGSPEKQQA